MATQLGDPDGSDSAFATRKSEIVTHILHQSKNTCYYSSSMEEHLICNQEAVSSSLAGSSMVSTSMVDKRLAKSWRVKP